MGHKSSSWGFIRDFFQGLFQGGRGCLLMGSHQTQDQVPTPQPGIRILQSLASAFLAKPLFCYFSTELWQHRTTLFPWTHYACSHLCGYFACCFLCLKCPLTLLKELLFILQDPTHCLVKALLDSLHRVDCSVLQGIVFPSLAHHPVR